MTTGLVVGKFCPLHKGHEALLAFAQARCDRLVVLSYTKPEFRDCPPERRAEWLAGACPDAIRLVLDDAALRAFAARTGEPPRLLPADDAPDEEQRGFVAWVCRAILGLTVDRVFTSEAYGDGFAASLARASGHPVEHLSFDSARARVPVSGTGLRDGTASHRAFLSEPVRRSLVRRVALIGGESTGKTTLAAALAQDWGTCWVPEYGRELWERRGGDLRFEDLLAIAREQVAHEEEALERADRWLVCDTTPLVTMFYSQAMFGRVEPALESLAGRTYDLHLLCAADLPFVQDGTRRDEAFRARQNCWYEERLAQGGVRFAILRGTLAERRRTAMRHLVTTRS